MATPEELRERLRAKRDAQLQQQQHGEKVHAQARHAVQDLIVLGYNFAQILDLTNGQVSAEHLDSHYKAIGYYRRKEQPASGTSQWDPPDSFGAPRWLNNVRNYTISLEDSEPESASEDEPETNGAQPSRSGPPEAHADTAMPQAARTRAISTYARAVDSSAPDILTSGDDAEASGLSRPSGPPAAVASAAETQEPLVTGSAASAEGPMARNTAELGPTAAPASAPVPAYSLKQTPARAGLTPPLKAAEPVSTSSAAPLQSPSAAQLRARLSNRVSSLAKSGGFASPRALYEDRQRAVAQDGKAEDIEMQDSVMQDSVMQDNVTQGNSVQSNVMQDNVTQGNSVPGNVMQDNAMLDDAVPGNVTQDNAMLDNVVPHVDSQPSRRGNAEASEQARDTQTHKMDNQNVPSHSEDVEDEDLDVQNMEFQNMGSQSKDSQSMESQSMESQNMEFQSMESQSMESQSMESQNKEPQNMESQDLQDMRLQAQKLQSREAALATQLSDPQTNSTAAPPPVPHSEDSQAGLGQASARVSQAGPEDSDMDTSSEEDAPLARESIQEELRKVQEQVRAMQQRKMAKEAQREAEVAIQKRTAELSGIAAKRGVLMQARHKLNLPKLTSRVSRLEAKLKNAKEAVLSAAVQLKDINAQSLELEKKEIRVRSELVRPAVESSSVEHAHAADKAAHKPDDGVLDEAPDAEEEPEAEVQKKEPPVKVLTAEDSPLRMFGSWRLAPLGPRHWFSPSFNGRFVKDLDIREFCNVDLTGETCVDRDCEFVHYRDFEVPSNVVVEYMATRGIDRPGYKEGLVKAVRTHLTGPEASPEQLAAAVVGFRQQYDALQVLDWDSWGVTKPM